MRNIFGAVIVIIAGVWLFSARPAARVRASSNPPQQTTQAPAQQSPTQQSPTQQQPASPQQAPAPRQNPAPQAVPARAQLTIILDPAHGGTDTGARGQTGAIEKDLVLQYARRVRAELERQGIRAALTRDDDSNPSYDDRASMANSYRDAIFISLHVASTGAFGTARVYYYRFARSPSGPPAAPEEGASPTKSAPPSVNSLEAWDEAQMPHVETSHRLADMLQNELALRFSGSPGTSSSVAVRTLRSVDAPAVAIELASVSVQDPTALDGMAEPLATSLARGVQAFRAAGLTGGK